MGASVVSWIMMVVHVHTARKHQVPTRIYKTLLHKCWTCDLPTGSLQEEGQEQRAKCEKTLQFTLPS